jgi:hypothetical protein
MYLFLIFLGMPPKVTDWILKPGAIPFEFFDSDGTSRCLPIFIDIGTKKETVQCNRCGIHINSAHLARHQQAAICDQKARVNARMQNQNAERERLAETVRILTEKSPPIQVLPQSALHNFI